MNELEIPGSPNWYLSSSFICCPDNTIIYAGTGINLIVLKSGDTPDCPVINKFIKHHQQRIICIAINAPKWNDPFKLVATCGEDKIVKLLDLDKGTTKQHNVHDDVDPLNNPVAVSIAGERIVSVSESGFIVVWQPALNITDRIPNIFGQKVKVKCMETCPHLPWLTAFGLTRGSVVIADLRKSGKVLYKMTSHDDTVINLSWCPIPSDIFRHSNNSFSRIKVKNAVKSSEKIVDDSAPTTNDTASKDSLDSIKNDESVDVLQAMLDKQTLHEMADEIVDVVTPVYEPRKELEFTKVNKSNPWGNLIFSDSDEETPKDDEKPQPAETMDFLKECQLLRNDILGTASSNDDNCAQDTVPLSEKNEDLSANISNLKLDETENVSTKRDLDNSDKENVDANVIECKPDESLPDTPVKNDKIEEKLTAGSVNEKISPIQRRFIKEPSDKLYLLASVCYNGKICIWRTMEGKLQHRITSVLATRTNRRNNRNAKFDWFALHWLKPDILLTSTECNKVVEIRFNCSDDTSTKLFTTRTVHSDHAQRVFTIMSPLKLYKTYKPTENDDDLKSDFIWTTAKDRAILCTSLGPERETLAAYTTLGSSIAHMALSPIDPTKLAFGGLDGIVHIWDLSQTLSPLKTMKRVMSRNNTKITRVAWHPTQETRLAYSNIEGRICEVDVTNLMKSVVIYRRYHKQPVNHIEWGPMPYDESGEYGLYSCSDGQLIVQKKHPNAEPIIIEIDCRVSTFAWNQDYTVLAVGNREGQVKLLTKDFAIYETFYHQKKGINCLAWHPRATSIDSGESPYAKYLAVANNEKIIYVYNCLTYMEKTELNSSDLVATLESVTINVRSLDWNPHRSGMLVVSTENGSAQIFDITKQELVAGLKYNILHSWVIWSPLNEYLLISGNTGNSLMIWDYRKVNTIEQVAQMQETIKKPKKGKVIDADNEAENGNNSSSHEDGSVIVAGASNSNTSLKRSRDVKQFTLPSVTHLQNLNSIELCERLLKLADNNNDNDDEDDDDDSGDGDDDKNNENSDGRVANATDCDNTNTKSSETETKPKQTLDPIMLFRSQKDIETLLRLEEETHINRSNWNQSLNIGLWRGDVAKSIDFALNSGVISPWMIHIAPIVSHQLYLDLCKKYAERLLETGDGVQASSYFLLCHQILRAIEALCTAHMFRDALVLAKCRLPPNNPIVTKIYEDWSQYATQVGNFEEAAHCLIKLKRFSDAGELLSKRSKRNVLNVALELAKKCKNSDLEKTIIAKLEQTPPDVPESRYEAMCKKELTTEVKETKENENKEN